MLESNETAEDVWTRILQTEKHCEFGNVTPAELIASKFLSLIRRSTGDYELEKNYARAPFTDIIHEYMYDRINDSITSNERRNTYKKGHKRESGQISPDAKETKNERCIRDKSTNTTVVDNVEHQTGQDNTYGQLERQSAVTAERRGTTEKVQTSKKDSIR